MGKWYVVTKRIRGRFYDYWQRTERIGGKVKTYNKYIGRATTTIPAATSIHTTQLTPPATNNTAPYTPQNVLPRIVGYGNPKTKSTRIMFNFEERDRKERERDRWGPLSERKKRQAAAILKAKRESRGVKSLNVFLARAIKRGRNKK